MYLLLHVAVAVGVVIVLQYCPCVDVDGVGYVLCIENNIYNIQFH